jgi:hypothetical protein
MNTFQTLLESRCVRIAVVCCALTAALAVPVSAGFNRNSLQGWHRLEFRAGFWDSGQRENLSFVVHTEDMTSVGNLSGALSYAYWVEDRFVTDITLRGLVAEATTFERGTGVSATDSSVVVTSALVGFRAYPFASSRSAIRLYVTAAIGPYLGIEYRKETGPLFVEETRVVGTFGSYLGGGVDIRMGRHLMAGLHAGYNLMADFPEPVGQNVNYSGVEVTAGISVLLGR